jgi:hypothetical protein
MLLLFAPAAGRKVVLWDYRGPCSRIPDRRRRSCRT